MSRYGCSRGEISSTRPVRSCTRRGAGTGLTRKRAEHNFIATAFCTRLNHGPNQAGWGRLKEESRKETRQRRVWSTGICATAIDVRIDRGVPPRRRDEGDLQARRQRGELARRGRRGQRGGWHRCSTEEGVSQKSINGESLSHSGGGMEVSNRLCSDRRSLCFTETQGLCNTERDMRRCTTQHAPIKQDRQVRYWQHGAQGRMRHHAKGDQQGRKYSRKRDRRRLSTCCSASAPSVAIACSRSARQVRGARKGRL
jgi:hypothetical protein